MNEDTDDLEALVAQLVGALELDPAYDVEAFLRAHASHASALRERIRRLRAVGLLSVSAAEQPNGAQASALGPLAWLVGRAPSDEKGAREFYERLFTALERKRSLFDRYEVLGELGAGGMGRVFEARDRELNRTVAMKVMRCSTPSAPSPVDLIGRFFEEAQVTAQLDHPSIVPVYDLGLDPQGAVYYTMRLVRGWTLGEVFERSRNGDGEWRQPRVLDVLARICEALAFAHERGVVHRDLKPSNIMVGGFGEVYLMDWGVAKVMGAPDRPRRPSHAPAPLESERSRHATPGSPLETAQGRALGTPYYMSPEQARGQTELVGPTTDVYALGAILYEFLCGFAPYSKAQAREPGARLRAVLTGPPDPIARVAPHAPAELLAICERAMHPSVRERYAGAGALAADLRAFSDQRVVQAYRTGPVVELRKWVARNRAFAAAMGVLLIVIATGGGGFAVVRASYRSGLEHERALKQAESRAADEIAGQLDLLASAAFDKQLGAGKQRERLMQSSQQIAREPALSFSRRAQLLTTIGQALRATGDWSSARLVLADALGALRSLEPREPTLEFNLLNALASVEGDLSLAEESLAHFEQALEAARAAGMDYADPVLTVYSNVIDAHLARGDLQSAEAHAQRVLEWLDANGARKTQVGAAISNQLGRIRRRQGRFAESAEHFRTALEIVGDNVGPTDSARLAIENNLAAALLGAGRHEEALELAESVVERAETVYEPDNPTLLTFLETRASSQFALRRFDDLEPRSRRILESRRKMLPADHPELSRSEINLATVLLELGSTAEATRLIDSALERYEARGLTETIDYAQGVWWRGKLAARERSCEPATRDFRFAIEQFERPDRGSASMVLTALDALARLQLDCGQLDAASETVRRLLDATPTDDAERPAREALAATIEQRLSRSKR